MNFQEFRDKSSKLKKIKLPGEDAHHKLAPLLRIQELDSLDMKKVKPQNAAVLAVFYPDKSNQVNFALILRKTYRGVHSNQVAFPGGRVEEEDRNLEHTALRETEEEIGIRQEDIHIIRELTQIYIPPSNFWVFPFIGIMDKKPQLVPQEEEVEDILEIDLDDFLSESSLTRQTLSTSYAKNIEVPGFLLNGHVVWGATAMMLSELKEILKQVL